MKDVLPELVKQKKFLLQNIQKTLQSWGYELIETPTLEFYDTVGGVSATIEQRLFKLLDRSGRTLVLRPDLTAPIARVVSSLLKNKPFPIRLAYEGNVYRAQEKEAGRNAEFPEVGIELIGEKAPDADAEVIALAVAALRVAQVPSFKLAIGHIGFLHAFLGELLNNAEQEQHCQQLLHQKNYVGYREYINQLNISAATKNELNTLLTLRGDVQLFSKVKRLVNDPKSKKAVDDLTELYDVLQLHGVQDAIIFDLSLISHRDYYTGVFFEVYADHIGFPICSGGRYDHLLGQFGRPAPATGFSLKVDRLLEVSQLQVPSCHRKVLITYTHYERKEAFQLANKLRQQQADVTLHRLNEQSVNKHKLNDVSGSETSLNKVCDSNSHRVQPFKIGDSYDEVIRLEQKDLEGKNND